MTAQDLLRRALRAVQARAEATALMDKLRARQLVPAADLAVPFTPWVHHDAKVDPAPYLAAADRIAEGWLDVFGLRDIDLGQPPRWNRDPKTGIEAPLVYGKALDCSDPDVVGDITYLWHPNRHRHLVTLSQAYALSGKRKYLAALAEQLDSWFIACPPRRGPNWASSLEAAVRLVNWSFAWQFLGGAGSRAFAEPPLADLRSRWLSSVYAHAEFIRSWFSVHKPAAALIGEAAGLFIAGLTWPHWRKSAEWTATGKAVVERAALEHNAADGVNRTQAVGYHRLALELQLLTLLAGKANGQWFCADYESRVESMLDYLASIMDCAGNVPHFGDDDDCSASSLSAAPGCAYRSMLAAGAVLFARGDFKIKARTLDDGARWLLGANADAQFEALDAEKTRLPLRQTFPESGYYVLGCDFDSDREVRLVVDAGPLGARVGGHGHADALAFTLSVGGREFFVDPGTYAYHSRERWRQYFRGTAAHNTVRIDGVDQSVQAGNFAWLNRVNAGCSLWLSSAHKDSFEGWHDGYARLDDPVQHRRLIELDKVARRLRIEDTLRMEEDHQVELLFHCHEHCEIEPAEEGFIIRRGDDAIRLTLPQSNSRTTVYRGSLAPMSGWISRGYDRREPAPTIVWQARLTGPSVLRSEILLP